MSVLISGSVVYDTILSFPGSFKESLLTESLDNLTVTFESTACERRFGGCAANIAYCMKLLGGSPIVWSSVGYDANDYIDRFKRLGIKTCLFKATDTMTAQCFTTIDRDGNQLSTFASNAMNSGELAPWPEDEHPEFAFFSPDTRKPMLFREKLLLEHGVPFLFDPGQTIPQFSAEELLRLTRESFITITNAYEIRLIMKKTGLSFSDYLNLARKLIITNGKEGARFFSGSTALRVPAYPVETADPVGAGDAFRGGLGYALEHHFPMSVALALASTMASFKVQTQGTQNYHPDKASIQNRFNSIFGKHFKLFS